MKKLFLLIMALLSIAGSMNAQTPVKVGNLYYYLFQYPNSNEAWVTSGNEPYTGNVEIPLSINSGGEYEVTKIGDDAFKNCVDLTSVTIPNSVTEIGKSSFQNCGLLSLTIPASVTSIGEKAFYGCSELATITVDENNTVYDSRGGCKAIIRKSDNTLLFGCKNTVIPSSVKAIGDYAFRSCSGMTTLEIPMGVRSIGKDAFDYCTNLASVTIPASVTSIGVNAFMECDALTSVTVAWATPLDISSKNLFYGCDNLSTATLHVPNGKTEVYSDASYGWNVFGKIEGDGGELPEGVEINETNFPDAKFRNFLLGKDYGLDGILTADELNAVTSLNLNYKGIKDLTGIQYFTKLVVLRCWGNDISGMNMFKLINSLPENKSSNYVIVVNRSGSNPDNFMTKGQVALAQSRGWYPYIYTYEEEEDPYDGEDLTITANFFPDENFRNYLKEQDYGQDGILSVTELDNLKTLDVPDMGIVTLKGIEHFTNLLFLYCASNSLSSLDLSQNTKLTNLHCSSNSLTSLDLSQNTGLLNLYCNENNLESLDLSQNTDLVYLACPLNNLTSLDVSSCPNLGYLSCYGNNITGDAMTTLVNSLPVKTTASEFYVCSDKCSSDNTITSAQAKVAKDKGWTVKKVTASGWVEYAGFDPIAINETNFPDANFRYIVRDKAINTNEDDYLSEKEVLAVTKLSVGSKEISNMKGIEYFTALQELICGHNHSLTSLNVSANKALTKLDCSACGLTSLIVSQNTALKELICYNNSLTSLDVSTNTALELLRCEYNTLTSLTVSKTNNTALKDVYCGGNQISGAAMTNLVNGLPTVTGDHGFNVCDDTQKTDNVITPAQVKTATDKGWIVLKFNGSWSSSYAGFDPIAINETNFPDANFRYFVRDKAINTNEDEYLSEKEVLAVTKLSVGSKEISNMKGIEYFTALQELLCGHNHSLTSLNVSANKALTKLDCSACGLTSLDVSQNTALKELICYNNSLTSLDVSTNTALELLRCEYNTLTSLTVSTQNTALKDVYCAGNQISGAAMTNLVNGLPTVTGDHGFNVCDDTQKTDNVITPAQVKTATDKGWMVLKFNGSWASQYAGYGDVDGDNKIDQNDLDAIEQIIMGKNPAGVGGYAGDLNNDMKTDAADIVIMVNILKSLGK